MEEKNEQQGMRIVSDEELQQVSGGVVIRRQRWLREVDDTRDVPL